jgi:hypothetical protein
MSKKDFEKYVKTRYRQQVEWYDKKSVLYKKMTYSLQIPIIVIAAITPIFAALQYTALTIIFSAAVSAGSAILLFGKFENLWHSYRTTCETLKKEMIYYKHKTNVYNKVSNREKLFIDRVECIISEECKDWTITMNKEE